jgi:serine protease Do
LTNELAESFGLSSPQGALVSNVEKNGPADKAGIQASDVILRIDDKPVDSYSDLPRLVAGIKPGTRVAVELWRKGKSMRVYVEVAEMPQDGMPAHADRKHADSSGGVISRMGITASELTADQLQQLQVSGGLLVERVTGSSARAAGLQQGDVLLAIGNVQIRSLAQLNELLKLVPRGRNVALLVRRGNNATYVAIRLDEK